MIKDALCLQEIILRYQEDYEYPAEYQLSKKDFKVMKVLLELLKLLSVLTEILSKSNVPMLADILVHFDGLNQLYCNMANDKSIPVWGRQGANRARLKLDKYYSMTDTSIMYCLAVVLHPSNRLAYLKRLGWQETWVEEARSIALNTWEQYYKPEDYNNGDDTSSQSQFGYSTFAEEVYGSFAEENDKPIDPVTDFVDAKAKAATAEAEAIAAEQEWLEDEVQENEGSEYDDEDVLEPSSEVEDIDLEDD
ncbi:hypothetical protein FRC11_007521 [Ceratobasidium sp. 423]|nr:hypothetical protein FRC11_007521 [Ceratobasidium sp. 423]